MKIILGTVSPPLTIEIIEKFLIFMPPPHPDPVCEVGLLGVGIACCLLPIAPHMVRQNVAAYACLASHGPAPDPLLAQAGREGRVRAGQETVAETAQRRTPRRNRRWMLKSIWSLWASVQLN